MVLSPGGLSFADIFPPPWWGRMQVGGQAAPMLTPTQPSPIAGDGLLGPT
jgi:hypothetical protein